MKTHIQKLRKKFDRLQKKLKQEHVREELNRLLDSFDLPQAPGKGSFTLLKEILQETIQDILEDPESEFLDHLLEDEHIEDFITDAHIGIGESTLLIALLER